MSLKALSNYTVYSRYAHYLPEKKRRETWEEITERVFGMHERKYAIQLKESEEFRKDFLFAKEMVLKKRVLGSQRALQFGGKWIEKTNEKIFNCSYLYIDRAAAFQEIEFLLLCGCGVGFSVQKHHVKKLPKLISFSDKDWDKEAIVLKNGVPEFVRITKRDQKVFVIEDSIEGWADAFGVLINSFFETPLEQWKNYKNKEIKFDFSKIRPEGALIAGQFKAPGPNGLKKALEKVRNLIIERLSSPLFDRDEFEYQLRPIDVYDIIMHMSDSVLSGGVRRSATICLFSFEDDQMMNAKTGNWFEENPQRARSNNSVLLVRDNTTWEQFEKIIKSTKEFGEPAFYFSESTEHGCNPCQPAWATVLTPIGIKKLGDIRIGDDIWSEDGWVQVTNKVCTGVKSVYEYKTERGSFFGTPNHRIVSHGKKIEVDLAESIDAFDFDSKFESCKILSKTKISDEEVFDITVSGGHHTYWTDGLNVSNCVEIGLYPQTEDGKSGVQFCNLCSINGKTASTEESFYDACRAAAIIGTMQAGYTDFKYLSSESRRITDREALLGVSITGLMDNPDVLLNPSIQRRGAEICKEVNKKIAKIIGINQAARLTCTKPEGSTSCVLQTASGHHPHHARKYLRRVQGNKLEFAVKHYKEINPEAVEHSVWCKNNTDDVISFACEVPKGAILKNDLKAVELLAKIRNSQINWVLNGENSELCASKGLHHNISNTINVYSDEWESVAKYIYDNKQYFTGVSLLPASGDLDYPQAPFVTILTPEEIVKEYGEGSILASGLVVDGLHAFDSDLWEACSKALGVGEVLVDKGEPIHPQKPQRKDFKSDKSYTNALANYGIELNIYYQEMGGYKQNQLKIDWIRRCKQFADRYFGGDLRKSTYCLKHVSLWHTWLMLKRTTKEIDWSQVVEDEQELVAADTLAAQACAGGKCLV